MDVPVSPIIQRRRRQQRWWLGGGAVAVLALVTLGLSRLQPAAPLVEKSSIWIDTVKRGEMIRQVRGNGILVPEDIRWIPTISAGRVERILVWPGTVVKADTILVELNNPEVEQAAFDAEWKLKAAEAELLNLRVQLDTQKLTQKANVASAQANYSNARLDFEVNDELVKGGLVPVLTHKQSKAKAEELANLFEIEQERLRLTADAAKAQLAVQEATVAQLRAQLEMKRHHVEALKVRAGMDGILQRLGDPANPLQIGQRLPEGAVVARVANLEKLKATIKIAETQARDIQLDQRAEIDTRNGVISGRVARIDPAVENGTVTIDVALEGDLPRGVRPDLSVDGTVQLERLENVLYVGRPVQGQVDSTVGIFKIVDTGKNAVRVPVRLGRSSVSTIEVIQGLEAGEKIILSDMSQWDGVGRVRIE